MPHITAEYSANLDADIDAARVVAALHEAALATGVFPLGGLRTRAARRDIFMVADGDPENAFVAVTARIGAGRDAPTRQRVGEALMAALERETAAAFAKRGLALTVEVAETDPVGALKLNNLHQRMKDKAS